MREYEKNIIELIIEEGEILDYEQTTDDEGTVIEFYTVKCDDETYHITKNNGEWVFIIRDIEN